MTLYFNYVLLLLGIILMFLSPKKSKIGVIFVEIQLQLQLTATLPNWEPQEKFIRNGYK